MDSDVHIEKNSASPPIEMDDYPHTQIQLQIVPYTVPTTTPRNFVDLQSSHLLVSRIAYLIAIRSRHTSSHFVAELN